MILSKNKVLFLFVISAFLILLNSGCSRKINDSTTIQLALPAGGFSSSKITEFTYSEPMSMQNVSISATGDDDGAEWNPTLNPSTLADVNCYMIVVSGPESDMQRNTCTTTTGVNLKVGRWAGGIPAGAVLSLEVPSGSKREITVIGFKANAGSCTNFKGADVNGMGLSEPHILGKIVKDLTPGSVAVSIPVAIDGSTLKIDDCAGPDFNMENAPLYFGDRIPADGTYIVAQDKWYSTISSSTYNIGGASRRIISFDTHPTNPTYSSYTFLEYDTAAPTLFVGDEVMIINQAMNGTYTGSGNQAVTPCGYRAWDGVYGFARVMAVSTTPHGVYVSKGTFADKLDWNPTLGAFDPTQRSQISTNFAAAATSNNDFCRLKLVKVIHFYNLTIDPAFKIYADLFEYDGNAAGIIPIRVAGTLSLGAASGISASGKGYAPVDARDGSGPRGASANATCDTTTDTSYGGACSPGSPGSGGGGHGSASTLISTLSGGDGSSNAIPGGYAIGDDCGDGSCFGNLAHKMFMGAAGGSTQGVTNVLGNRGGGIVYLMAKNVVVTSGAANISSSGLSGEASSNTAYGSSGGHAGGSVMFGYGNAILTGGATFSIEAAGGSGGAATSSNGGGGGGGGGRLHITTCTSNATTPISLLTRQVTGGLGGYSTSGVSGNPGLLGSIFERTVPCN